ncbi:MAG: PD40 domain-containing protein [Anaerolineales bacterium]|nr:PD40 domain-containing protein [Anaerolineales bacterium]
MSDGYYRFPTIHQDTIVFVSEDDLWSISRHGGVARRLTSNLGQVNYPALSPDGEWLAFVGREEGMPEVYLMSAAGGSARRMTYLNHTCQVLGWTPDAQQILFSTNYGHFHPQEYALYTVAIDANAGQVTPAGRTGAGDCVWPRRRRRDRPQHRRPGALEALPRGHGGPSLDRSRGQWRV